jgi:hypothetical protein
MAQIESKAVDNKNVEFIYSVVKEQLRNQFDTIDAINRQISMLLGVNSIVLSIIFTFLQRYSMGFVIFSSVFLCASLMLFLSARISPLSWRFDPEPQSFQRAYYGETYEKTISVLTSNMVKSYESNKQGIDDKTDMFKAGCIMFVLGMLCIFVGVVVAL